MKSIGIRELRQHASVYIRLVEAGESIEVTDRGRPVAMITPVKHEETTRERLIREGRLIPAKNVRREPFKPAPAIKGVPLPSELLMQDRYGE